MVQVGDVSIGSGKPKICASITETDRKSIIAAADILLQKRVDIIEWRIDYYSEVHHWDMVLETLQRLKMSLYGRPLLVTLPHQGGGRLSGDRDTGVPRVVKQHCSEWSCRYGRCGDL